YPVVLLVVNLRRELCIECRKGRLFAEARIGGDNRWFVNRRSEVGRLNDSSAEVAEHCGIRKRNLNGLVESHVPIRNGLGTAIQRKWRRSFAVRYLAGRLYNLFVVHLLQHLAIGFRLRRLLSCIDECVLVRTAGEYAGKHGEMQPRMWSELLNGVSHIRLDVA